MPDIPDEAVEAVARAMQHWCEYGTIHLLGHVPKNWDEDDPDWWMGLARAALTAAYPHLLDEDWRTDWENDLLANAPEWLDDDVAQCEIVIRYVRWLEAENARLRAQVEAVRLAAITYRERHPCELLSCHWRVKLDAALSDEGKP